MTALLIGYARCSTDEQDLTVQREGLAGLGVTPDRIYVDHGLTDCNRERPGLREALAACREGDTLVVTKLDGWPGPCRTPGRSRTSSRLDGSGSASVGLCTTRPTRWADCCSTCWRWSLSSRPTSSA